MPHMQFGNTEVPYHVKRSSRRSISARITHDGLLEIHAPHLVPEFLIRRFLQHKSAWILSRLAHRTQLLENGELIQYRNGEYLPFFDSSYLLKITVTDEAPRPRLYPLNNTFQVLMPVSLSPEQQYEELKTLIHSWYLRNTKPVLEQRVQSYAQQMGVRYASIRVKDVTSHWGSCSIQKNLNFNYRIAMLPIELCDYIIVHELCHLTEMNHSSRFWALVEQVIPNYKELRQTLKKNHMFLD